MVMSEVLVRGRQLLLKYPVLRLMLFLFLQEDVSKIFIKQIYLIINGRMLPSIRSEEGWGKLHGSVRLAFKAFHDGAGTRRACSVPIIKSLPVLTWERKSKLQSTLDSHLANSLYVCKYTQSELCV